MILEEGKNWFPNQQRYVKWNLRMLSLAQHISTWSKDPSTQVGAVITDENNRIISVGYNGFPKKVKDTGERYNNREEKYKFVVHAEMNAIVFAKTDLKDTILYTYPFQPCATCTGIIIQAGISSIVSLPPTAEMLERWGDSFKFSSAMLTEAGTNLYLHKRETWLDFSKIG